ncbi:MAG: hypothetical protein HQL51_02960 [Magnetococcales bacterium]|nr:hypothetical protein [Magnetococcales bacterium]
MIPTAPRVGGGASFAPGIRLTFLGLTALIAFLAVGIPAVWLLPAARSHVVLALGLLPLMMGAMIYFTQPLTRSAPPPPWVWLIPLLALVAGGLAAFSVALDQRGVMIAAPLAQLAALLLLGWMQGRARNALGGVHPGLRWYQGALIFLLLGLSAILAARFFPTHWAPLRSLHLHLNLMGFIGLTAIGTLQTLLPTAGRYPDAEAHARLRLDWKYAALGTLASALGAAGWHAFSFAGLVLWMIPVVRLGRAVWRHRAPILAAGGAAIALAGAVIGFGVMMISGVLIVLKVMSPQDSLPLFFTVFLFPLVTGALSHLLPLWLRPGPDSAARVLLAQRLGRWSGPRTLLFLTAGILIAVGQSWAALPGAAGMALFVIQTLVAIAQDRKPSLSHPA